MRTLAIESATEACSVALFDSGELLDARHEVLGRGHAERLVPMIAELPDRGRAQNIRVSLGPGSFTGTRIGIAAAGALGLAWAAEVRGYPTLALVAAIARAGAEETVTVSMAGGHGEWFVQHFRANGLPQREVVSVTPQVAAGYPMMTRIAGSRAKELARLVGGSVLALDILPDARHALAVPVSLLDPRLVPLYGRPPDARLPG